VDLLVEVTGEFVGVDGVALTHSSGTDPAQTNEFRVPETIGE
jgi:hypothetical protein